MHSGARTISRDADPKRLSRIRTARAARGYNQREFASVCHLHRAYIGGVERGERNVTFSALCTLCVALGCDVAALTPGIPEPTVPRT